MKASSIKAMSEKLVREYGGEIPCDIDELLSFPGVGRKIANLVLGDVYGLGGIVADTHFMRICGKIGFYEEGLRDPARVERIMDPLIPPGYAERFLPSGGALRQGYLQSARMRV